MKTTNVAVVFAGLAVVAVISSYFILENQENNPTLHESHDPNLLKNDEELSGLEGIRSFVGKYPDALIQSRDIRNSNEESRWIVNVLDRDGISYISLAIYDYSYPNFDDVEYIMYCRSDDDKNAYMPAEKGFHIFNEDSEFVKFLIEHTCWQNPL